MRPRRPRPRFPEKPMPDSSPAHEPGHGGHDPSTPVVTHISDRRLKLLGGVAAGVAVVVVVGGLVSRVSADQGQKTWTHEQAIPTISLAKVEAGGERQLVLPGDIQAFYNAPIHARVSGYLKKW